MKKTVRLMLGTAMMGLLSIGAIQAQEKTIELKVQTMNRADLTGAWLYAGTEGVNYYVDQAQLVGINASDAVDISTLSNRIVLNVGFDSNSANPIVSMSGIDSTEYGMSFIVVRDEENRFYIYGNTMNLANGIFGAAPIFAPTAVSDSLVLTMGVNNGLAMPEAKARDRVSGYRYTSLQAALGDEFSYWVEMLDTAVINSPVDIEHHVVVSQNGYPVVSDGTAMEYLFKIGATNAVSWEGGMIRSTQGNHFRLNDYAILTLNQMTDSATATIVNATDNTLLMATGCTFATTGESAAVVMAGNSHAILNNMTISGGAYSISIPERATGRVDIDAASVQNNMSGYTKPIQAFGYYKDGLNRTYLRTLQGLSNSAMTAGQDSVFMAGNWQTTTTTGATDTDTIDVPMIVDLGGYVMSNSIFVRHEADTVSIVNGTLTDITNYSTQRSPIVLTDVDFNGRIHTDASHPVILRSGRYAATEQLPTGVIIEGGKYTDTTACSVLLADRHFFINNTDDDASIYPFTVIAGYRVTYHNFDCNSNDTTILYYTDDNKISPVLSSPRYTTTGDTVFLAWVKDASLDINSAWLFSDYTLSSDTNLYAKWYFRNSTEYTYTVKYIKNNPNGSQTELDSIVKAAAIDSRVAEGAATYRGMSQTEDTIIIEQLTSDTTIIFYYTPNSYEITWDANGGVFADGTTYKTTNVLFGEPIAILESEPMKRGNIFNAWTPEIPETMPATDFAIVAQYEADEYELSWVGADTTVDYTAEDLQFMSAILVDPLFNDTISSVITFIDATNGTAQSAIHDAGQYKMIATLTGAYRNEYALLNDTVQLTVRPALLTVSGIEVNIAKIYDGTNAAEVSANGTIEGVLGTDELTISTVATFNDETVGEGKTITAYYTIGGDAAANYSPLSGEMTFSNATIIERMLLDESFGENGIDISAEGYCSGTDTIKFHLVSGSPDEYTLIFNDDMVNNQHFVNNGWTSLDLSTDSIITIDIPADAQAGNYQAVLIFRNSNYPTLLSNSVTIHFSVNMPNIVTMPLFKDVIAIVDPEHHFTDVQWFHNGVLIPGATKMWYQEEGGLTGEYYVTARYDGTPITTCPQTDMTTQVSDSEEEVSLSVYPNPTTSTVTVSINNSREINHAIRVMNVMGVTVENSTFTGTSTNIDFGRLGAGSYTVSVDGQAVRVIKK